MNATNITFTLKNDLCTGCGICKGACPSGAISFHTRNGEFRPIVDKTKCRNDKGCRRCYDACPGLGVDLKGIAKKKFNEEGIIEDKMCGRYHKCFTGHSNDYEIRYHSASGGMVSQILIWLLETGKIDGALVTRFNNRKPLFVESFIATTRDEIISARSSRYAPASFHDSIEAIKKASGTRFVVVGLPCHIEGYRKLMEIDKILREKIYGLFSLYCACTKTFNQTEYLMKEQHIDLNSIHYFQYRDEGCLGSMVVKYDNEGIDNEYRQMFQRYYHPLRCIFTPRRCILCIDHYGELGDISFGDIHKEPYSNDKIGINSIIVRNKSWLNILEEAKSENVISLEEIPFETISSTQKTSFLKKGRNGAFINLGKKLGWVMPEYGITDLKKPTTKDIFKYCMNRILQFIGRNRSLWWTIPYIKGKVNIH